MKYILCMTIILAITLTACSGPAECRGLSGSDYDFCVIETATAQGDTTLCKDVSTTTLQVWCYNSIANATDDQEVCNLIESEASREFCKQKLVIKKDNLEACDTLGTEMAREGCYDSFAYGRADPEICTKISPSEHREECIEDISRNNKDPYGCLLLSDLNESRKDYCLLANSVASGTLDTCKYIKESAKLRGYCELNVAIAVNDGAICEQIDDEGARFACDTEFNSEVVE